MAREYVGRGRPSAFWYQVGPAELLVFGAACIGAWRVCIIEEFSIDIDYLQFFAVVDDFGELVRVHRDPVWSSFKAGREAAGALL